MSSSGTIMTCRRAGETLNIFNPACWQIPMEKPADDTHAPSAADPHRRRSSHSRRSWGGRSPRLPPSRAPRRSPTPHSSPTPRTMPRVSAMTHGMGRMSSARTASAGWPMRARTRRCQRTERRSPAAAAAHHWLAARDSGAARPPEIRSRQSSIRAIQRASSRPSSRRSRSQITLRSESDACGARAAASRGDGARPGVSAVAVAARTTYVPTPPRPTRDPTGPRPSPAIVHRVS